LYGIPSGAGVGAVHRVRTMLQENGSVTRCKGEWDEEKSVIILADGHTYARGLTKTLSAYFSPNFSISVVLQGLRTIKPKKYGRVRAIQIEQELSDHISNKRLPTRVSHPVIHEIYKALFLRDLHPIESQLNLGCSCMRLGTRVDLVCRNPKSEIVLVELKCWFDDYYDVQNQGFFQKPFDHMKISFRRKHHLQVVITRWLFKHCSHAYENDTLGSCHLLRVFQNDKGVLTHEMDTVLDTQICGEDPVTTIEKCISILTDTKKETKRKRVELMRAGSRLSLTRFQKTMDSSKRCKTIVSGSEKKLTILPTTE